MEDVGLESLLGPGDCGCFLPEGMAGSGLRFFVFFLQEGESKFKNKYKIYYNLLAPCLEPRSTTTLQRQDAFVKDWHKFAVCGEGLVVAVLRLFSACRKRDA